MILIMSERQDPADMIRYESPGVVFNDPESEAILRPLAEAIEEELRVQIAMQRSPSDPEELWDIAGLIANAVLDSYVVRERNEPRVSWPKP